MSCVPNVANFSELSIPDCPFGFIQRFIKCMLSVYAVFRHFVSLCRIVMLNIDPLCPSSSVYCPYNFQNVDDIFIQTIDHDCIDSNKAIRWFLRWFHWSLPKALTMDNEFIDSIEHLSNFSRLVGLFQNKRLLVIISGVRLDKYGLWAVANHRDPYL